MTTTQALEGDAHGLIVLFGLYLHILQSSGNIDTTGTSDVEFTLSLRVEVEQHLALHGTGLQAEGT